MPLPKGACDSHCHLFGPFTRYPLAPARTYEPAEAAFEAYEQLQRRLGVSRGVFVQPAAYGRDHSALLDAITTDPKRFRGVGLIDSATPDRQIETLDQGGVCGARFNFVGHLGGATIADVQTTARRVSPLGWHIVLHVDSAALLQLADMISALSVPVVIDHMARVPAADGLDQPAFRLLLDILSLPHVWVKISAADRMVENAAQLHDATPFMAAISAQAGDRTLWGTDWPHPNTRFIPDDRALIDLFTEAVPDADRQHAILVRNPERLFQFRPEDR